MRMTFLCRDCGKVFDVDINVSVSTGLQFTLEAENNRMLNASCLYCGGKTIIMEPYLAKEFVELQELGLDVYKSTIGKFVYRANKQICLDVPSYFFRPSDFDCGVSQENIDKQFKQLADLCEQSIDTVRITVYTLEDNSVVMRMSPFAAVSDSYFDKKPDLFDDTVLETARYDRVKFKKALQTCIKIFSTNDTWQTYVA